MSAQGKTAQLLDALHAELLVDVQTLTRHVEALREDLPRMTGDVRISAQTVTAASEKTVSEFEAMGRALIELMKRQAGDVREAALDANAKAASTTKGALENFTKYFWLLAGLSGLNALLLVALLAAQLQK